MKILIIKRRMIKLALSYNRVHENIIVPARHSTENDNNGITSHTYIAHRKAE